MVRTKADRVPGKAVGSKAPGKVSAGSAGKKSNGRKSAGKSYGGGNPYHPRETPEWQKPITSFMNISSKTTTSNASPIKEKIENQASRSNCEDAEESTTEEDETD